MTDFTFHIYLSIYLSSYASSYLYLTLYIYIYMCVCVWQELTFHIYLSIYRSLSISVSVSSYQSLDPSLDVDAFLLPSFLFIIVQKTFWEVTKSIFSLSIYLSIYLSICLRRSINNALVWLMCLTAYQPLMGYLMPILHLLVNGELPIFLSTIKILCNIIICLHTVKWFQATNNNYNNNLK